MELTKIITYQPHIKYGPHLCIPPLPFLDHPKAKAKGPFP